MTILEGLQTVFEELLGQVMTIPLQNTLSVIYTMLNTILLWFAGTFGAG